MPFTFDNTSQTFDGPEGKLHYHEAGSGPALLLLHGSGPGVTGWANYQGNLAVFAEHFRCLILDFPGYGKSEADSGDPVGGCVTAAVALLDHLNIERAHIIGNSLGGIVGSHIAAQFPQRVNRFVTIGGIGINIFSAFPGEGLNLLTAFTEDPSRERVEQWLRSMVYDQSLVTDELIDQRFQQAMEPVTLATTRKLYSRQAIGAIADYRRGVGATQILEHLPKIQAPTLITWGRDDRVSPMDIAFMPMRIIPNCELHVFPNCGHWAMIECKQGFESLVKSFLLQG
jgi:2-hydroxy-6-oxonona-2,4-dienedioate hydrolase